MEKSNKKTKVEKKTLTDILGPDKFANISFSKDELAATVAALFQFSEMYELAAQLGATKNDIPDADAKYILAKTTLNCDLAYHKIFGCDDPSCVNKVNVQRFKDTYSEKIKADKHPLEL